jgi:hypothetical protein
LNEFFRRVATRVACAVGSPWAFLAAFASIAAWAAAGPYLDYSPGWQMVVNTGTTIATFLMLFVLQNSQIRDTKAINIKLDELLRALEGARTGPGHGRRTERGRARTHRRRIPRPRGPGAAGPAGPSKAKARPGEPTMGVALSPDS